MAEAYKVLGQSAPVAATVTTLCTVPASNNFIVSTLTVCNRGAAAGTFRVAVSPAGAALANQHYVYYDAAMGGNVTVAITIGITMAATDVLRVYASTADFTFIAFGTEVSP